ncbi:kynureninase, partial [Phenoliferia sp. Uapishka_3]
MSASPIEERLRRHSGSSSAKPSQTIAPSTSRDLPRPSPSHRGHPNKATHGGGGDERVSQGVRFARCLTGSGSTSLNDIHFAEYMDAHDKLAHLRYSYHLPQRNIVWPESYRKKLEKSGREPESGDEEECVYLAGNSLGCMPKGLPERLMRELEVWGQRAVLAHVEHPLGHPWVQIDDLVTATLAEIVGAKESEVACMGTLTANLHALLTSFYKPTPRRHKIMYEGKAFPSDSYAFASQIALHDYPPSSLLPVDPLPGEFTIRTEEILKIIEEQGDTIAVICFGAVQYYSGQYFDMEKITAAGHAKGCLVAFDCAHAVGNVDLQLHDWGVDFAMWCSYKYLNAGPGGIAGIYVHERHEKHARYATPCLIRLTPSAYPIVAFDRLQGWWGHDLSTRFAMPSQFSPAAGAAGWQFSNPSVIDVITLNASLDTFRAAGQILPSTMSGGHINGPAPILASLREKSIDLTAYLELLLKSDPHYVKPDQIYSLPESESPRFTIITPEDQLRRGAQLSLLFHPEKCMIPIFEQMREGGVLGDERKPAVIRLAPVPMYVSWSDVFTAAKELSRALKSYPEWVVESKNGIAAAEDGDHYASRMIGKSKSRVDTPV